ncbi:MAG: hypothetical protein EAY75_15745 [Bacteroidetes bacterium]|nr:MAG: hypothetical protein EAY75_15745 [Bacteroidota bacterium]
MVCNATNQGVFFGAYLSSFFLKIETAGRKPPLLPPALRHGLYTRLQRKAHAPPHGTRLCSGAHGLQRKAGLRLSRDLQLVFKNK